MNPARIFLVTTFVACLGACGTVMPTAQSGFLSDYTALKAMPDASSANRAALDPIDPAQITIDAVVWRAKATTDISTDERDALTEVLRSELALRVHAMPAVAHGRPATLRAAITKIETVSPALNTVASMLLFGPLDRGGAAVEIEAVDPQTGRQLAAMTQGYFAPLSELKARFSKLAPAEIALRKAAADFVPLMNLGSQADSKSAQR
jgi:hypothetical protein